MAISESFLVNPDRLNPIIETLIENGEVPSKITEEELKSIGFSNPSDLLVIHILKELDILSTDGTPTKLFKKLIDPETSKLAIAEGVIHGYKDLIDKHENILKMQASDVQEKVSNYFEGQKTDLVLKYMANTFTKLVTYAGVENVEEAYKNYGDSGESSENKQVEELVEEHAEASMNESRSNGAIADIMKEQKGEASIEEVMNIQQSSQTEEPVEEHQAETEEIRTDIQETTKTASTIDNNDSIEEPVDQKEEEEPEEDENLSIMETKMPTMNSSNKVQQAFIKKADLLYKLERFEELAPTLNSIINKFDDAEDDDLKQAVAKSVIRRAQVLAKLKRNDELLPAFDEIINRFEDSENQNYYEHASTAMLNKAGLLESKNETGDLLPLYDKITERLNDSSNQKIKEKVDQVYLKRMQLVLDKSDDENLSLNAINGVIDRFEERSDADKYLEEAMFAKATILEEMGSDEEALEAYSQFIDRFGDLG